MNIADDKKVDRFVRRHRDAATHIKRWKEKVLKARWNTPHEVPTQSSGIRRIGNRRLIFNISKNKYRLVAEVDYTAGTLKVLFIGTHASYDEFMKRYV